jgi:hypothetical protein
MPVNSNCASAWPNQTMGHSGQKGGRRAATRYTSAPWVSSTGSIVAGSQELSSVSCRGHQYMWDTAGIAWNHKYSITHITIYLSV